MSGGGYRCPRCGAEVDAPVTCDRCMAELYPEPTAAEVLDERLTRAGIPRRLRRLSWEVWREVPSLRAEVEALRGWAASDPWCAVLSGPAGAGKTMAAVCVLRAVIEAGGWGRFVYAPDWIASCRGADSPAEAEARFVRVATDRDLLVLDDLSVRERETAFGLDLWDRLVDYRYREELKTIITTNHPSKVIVARLGERVFDRLREGLLLRWSAPSGRRLGRGSVNGSDVKGGV